jgi:hypothetical protein
LILFLLFANDINDTSFTEDKFAAGVVNIGGASG